MDKKIQIILEDAGWYYGRQIETDYMLKDIERNNLIFPNKTVIDFLKEFGNLEFEFGLTSGGYGNIKLVIDEVLPFIESRHLFQWRDFAQEELVPVGTMFNDDAYLFISFSGKFYMAHQNNFFLIGENFLDCLDKVINQKNIVCIQ